MRPAPRIASVPFGFLLAFLCSLPPVAGQARHAISFDEVATPAGATHAEQPGVTAEIDRRSHPVLMGAWDAILGEDWENPGLSGLPGLEGARVLHGEHGWALIYLRHEQAEALRAAGVRLNPPRPRPSESFRPPPMENPMPPAALTVLQSLAAAVNVEQEMSHLNAIATSVQTRYYNTAGMQTATQYALDRFSQYGLDSAYFDTFTYSGYSVRNVVGVKIGTVYPSRIYMICGHMDSTSPQASSNAPGAEDNGSGSVAVLEAARLLAPLEFESTIYFVCFTAEEVGLVGSEHLAAIADSENWDLRGVIVMDMVGYDTSGSPDIWIEGFPNHASSVTLMNNLESVVNGYTDMGVYRYPSTGWGSDHVPFDSHGFPAVLAIDYDWDNYSCYHQTCDTVANIVPSQLRRMSVSTIVMTAQLAVPVVALGSIDGTADKIDSSDDSGVLIEVKGTEYGSVISGAGGVFDLADLLPGNYSLRASAVGYESAELNVTVAAGAATPVPISLNPLTPSRVRGVVSLLGGGNPAGARVFVENQPGYAEADFSGAYLIDPVYPGQIVVSANYEGYMPGVVTVTAPAGGELTGVNFTLKQLFDFESSSEGLVSSSGWEWGSDTQSGAHSGTKVWGTRLNANYANCADYRLDIPALDLKYYATARLHFWHWYKTEAGYDGGNIQVSTDGGSTWSLVTPVGSYAGTLAGSCNPLAGQAGYVGTKANWSEVVVNLDAYAGRSIRVRFRFGSDNGTTNRGWYIDDLSLEGALVPTGVAENPIVPPGALAGLSIAPNPTGDRTQIRFTLGVPGTTWLSVHDASGRTVRSLIEAAVLTAGPQVVPWNGRDDAERPLPAGVYWVRVFANGRSLSAPVALLH